MPTYEYRCSSDYSMVEMHQSFEDSSIPQCPMCGQQMNKQFHATSSINVKGMSSK